MTITASYMSDNSDATHVVEGHDEASHFSYRILLTVTEVNPGTLAMDELKLQDIKYSCLPNMKICSVSMNSYFTVDSHHDKGQTSLEHSTAKALAICKAVVYHIFYVYRIVEVGGVDREQVDARVQIESNCYHVFVDMDEGDDEDYIRPTPASRESVMALEKVVIAENQDTGCVICLEDFCFGSEATKMPCSHLFRGDCIVRWLKNQFVCPCVVLSFRLLLRWPIQST